MSEVVSAILLAAIVAAVGVSIYLAAVSHVASTEQTLVRLLEEKEAEALAKPAILYAYVRNSTGQLWIVLVTGPGSVRVDAVYLGSQLLQPIGFRLPLTLPPDSTVTIGPFNVSVSPPGGTYVKVSTNAGEVEAVLDLLP